MELETTRLYLRALEQEEFAAMLQGMQKMEQMLDLTPSGMELAADTRQAMERMYRQICEQPQHTLWYTVWQIILKKDNRPVGSAGFKGPPDVEGCVEIGYGVHPSDQGRGYATEATVTLCRWALDRPGVIAVTAETEPGNTASHRVLEKAGMVQTGVVDGNIRWSL